MPLSLVFWNIKKNEGGAEKLIKDLVVEAKKLASGKEIIFCIAEKGDVDDNNLMIQLNSTNLSAERWRILGKKHERFIIFTNSHFGNENTREKGGSAFINFAIQSKGGIDILNLVFVHLPSPMSAEYRDVFSTGNTSKLNAMVEAVETETASTMTIVMGDFNTPPYSPAMTSALGLNAAMCKKLAQKKPSMISSCREDTEFIPRYYNPMWNLLGDRTSSNQPASFYRTSDHSDGVIWRSVDQMILRPDLMNNIISHPKIMTSINGNDLIEYRSGNLKSISDHLPIFIDIDVQGTKHV